MVDLSGSSPHWRCCFNPKNDTMRHSISTDLNAAFGLQWDTADAAKTYPLAELALFPEDQLAGTAEAHGGWLLIKCCWWRHLASIQIGLRPTSQPRMQANGNRCARSSRPSLAGSLNPSSPQARLVWRAPLLWSRPKKALSGPLMRPHALSAAAAEGK